MTTNNTSGLKTHGDALIRRIDGASFYELATGHQDGLQLVFDAIPKGLREIDVNIDNHKIDIALNYFKSTIG